MKPSHIWMIFAVTSVSLLASLAMPALDVARHLAGQTDIQPLEVTTPVYDAGEKRSHDMSSIRSLPLFGETFSPVQKTVSNTNPESINITLHGVLLDRDASKSRAFIRSKRQFGAFSVGDEIEGAEILSIDQETVTLLLNDNQIVIGFSGMESSQVEDTVISEKTDAHPNPFARLAAALVPGQGSIDLRDPPPPETTEDYISLWRDRITRNPQDAMNRIGVEIVDNGYRVLENPNIGVTLAGLKPGDVVTKLNGQTVGVIDRDRALYDEVASSGIARLEIIRNDQPMLLTFPLR